MPSPAKGARLGGSAAHEKHILSNLARALFEHGSITTTHAKARRLRPYAERLITKARRGDMHARRQVIATLHDTTVAHILFTDIGPRFASRPGGYTRITKVGPRHGDNAPMAVISLVGPLDQAAGEAEAATRRAARGNTPLVVPAPAEPADGVGGDPVQDEADDDAALAETSTAADGPSAVDGPVAVDDAGPRVHEVDAGATAAAAERAADGAEQAGAEAADEAPGA